jgi:hypothetical protein
LQSSSHNGDNVQALIDHLANEGYEINRDPNDWNNGSPKKPGLHINDVYNVLHDNGYRDKNLTEGEVSIPVDAIEKLVVKRALRGYIGSRPLGEWEDNPEQVVSGKTEMALATAAITYEVSNDAAGPIAWVMDVAIAYHLGAMYHGWVNTNYPDQVYTYRPSNLDPINFPSSSNDPNNPNFDPRTAVGIFGMTILALDQLKAWEEEMIKAKKAFIAHPSSTDVKIPIPTSVGPLKN